MDYFTGLAELAAAVVAERTDENKCGRCRRSVRIGYWTGVLLCCAAAAKKSRFGGTRAHLIMNLARRGAAAGGGHGGGRGATRRGWRWRPRAACLAHAAAGVGAARDPLDHALRLLARAACLVGTCMVASVGRPKTGAIS